MFALRAAAQTLPQKAFRQPVTRKVLETIVRHRGTGSSLPPIEPPLRPNDVLPVRPPQPTPSFRRMSVDERQKHVALAHQLHISQIDPPISMEKLAFQKILNFCYP